jgi:hypothetical protein
MFKTRFALLGVLALFIASGIATSTASAAGPFWHVAGAKLAQGTAKQVKTQAKLAPILNMKTALGELTMICHNSYSEGKAIENSSTQGQDKGRVVFEQCKVTSTIAGCTEVSQPIITNQLKSFLAFNPNNKQQKFVDVFEPQQGNTFVVLHFNKGCFFENVEVSGAVAAEIVPIEKESQELLLDFPESPITTIVHGQQERKIGLTFAGEPMILDSVYGARLATNQPWGVFGQ